MSVLPTFTLVTGTENKEVKTAKTSKSAKMVETAKAVETTRAGKDGKQSKGGENLRLNLVQIPCIWYSVTFQKKSMPVFTLLDLGSKVNAIYPNFAKELDLLIKPTDVRAQKIDGTMLDTFGMVVVPFLVINKANWVKFFEKTFLVANVNPEIIFGMLFLTLSGANVDFLGWELQWKTYTIKEAL